MISFCNLIVTARARHQNVDNFFHGRYQALTYTPVFQGESALTWE